jgi:hypothetical protein
MKTPMVVRTTYGRSKDQGRETNFKFEIIEKYIG